MKFTIVIPARDRPHALRACLERVLPQADDCEVIVTDDSRGNAVQEMVEQFQHVRLANGPRRGPAANRNAGARVAAGEWLLFLDDDCLPTPGWLAAYAAAAGQDCDVLEGRTECPLPDRFTFHDVVENLDGGCYWSCNLAIRRAQFEALGGFDEDFAAPAAEDMELAWRIQRRQLKCHFVKEAVVIHPARKLGLAGLARRTALHKWTILYRVKTGQSAPLACSPIHAGASLAATEILDTARMTYRLLHDRRRIKGKSLLLAWRWLTLWLFLPSYALWEQRWRKRLAKRTESPADPVPAAYTKV
jgi:GT2 family glycosyltransferase